MSMQKRVALDQIEIAANGTVFIRLLKQVVDTGPNGEEKVLFSEPHRSVIEPTADTTKRLTAVSKHLTDMGWEKISGNDSKLIEKHTKVAHTPDTVRAFKTGLKRDK